ncbi:helix-turn-helix domain-containing protein [Enterococcus devriesei]|uniref:helix-turn-helix domain-containing protein n=1 Tax=Enterococcus devriesei TaxID=319970 RepID=UPI0036D22491
MQTKEAIKTYLLSRKVGSKLAVFQYLLKYPAYLSHSYLIKNCHISENTLTLYLKELNQDLQQKVAPTIRVISRHGFTALDLSGLDSAECYYKLLGAYCKEATNYRIVTSLLNRKVNSIIALSHETNFSVPYLYSRMKEIDQFLALFGLAISFTKSGERKIVGTEIQIQYCLIDVYWRIFANTELPFREKETLNTFQLVHHYLDFHLADRLTSGQLDKVALVLMLCTDNFPFTSFETVKTDIAKYPSNRIFLQPELDFLKSDLDLCDEQRIILNILLRLTTAKVGTDEENYRHYIIFQENHSPFFDTAKDLVDALMKQFDLAIPENKQVLAILNICRNRLFNTYLHPAQPNMVLPSVSMQQDDPTFRLFMKRLRKFYQKFDQENPLYSADLEKENVDWIMEDLFHLYDCYRQIEPLRIGVNCTSNYYVSDDIIGKIQQVFTDDLQLQKSQMAECDIVISDCPLPDLAPEIKKIYFIDGLANRDSLQLLMERLAQEIFALKNQLPTEVTSKNRLKH